MDLLFARRGTICPAMDSRSIDYGAQKQRAYAQDDNSCGTALGLRNN
jgi:hypothetical protein